MEIYLFPSVSSNRQVSISIVLVALRLTRIKMEQNFNTINTNVSLSGTYRCSRKLFYNSSQRYVIFMRVYEKAKVKKKILILIIPSRREWLVDAGRSTQSVREIVVSPPSTLSADCLVSGAFPLRGDYQSIQPVDSRTRWLFNCIQSA